MTTPAFASGAAQSSFDPYACDEPGFSWWDRAAQPHEQDQGDHLLPPPNAAERLDITIDPRDRRRLDLHAALTAAGIPPLPEDREAIDRLSALPADINIAVRRWIEHAA
ncbi:hypothetical protein ABZ446_42030 [Streptomyces sp. NPDC005813]|uniref:hypothetical protein n=1 Tax=Streptomyces sp. NPDC005813 TaxID=3155592 RepID=UPI003410CE98